METRQRLIDRMKALMSEVDYEDIRIADIAAAAGVSVGTFYLYFKSKTDLVIQIVRGLNEDLAGDLTVSPDETVARQYRRYCERYRAKILSDGFCFSRGIQLAMIEDAIRRTEVAVDRQRSYLSQLIERGFDTGELVRRDMTGERFADLFLATINGTLLEWIYAAGDLGVLERGFESIEQLLRLVM